MILYTPMSQADIYPNSEEGPQREFVSYQGRTLYVEQGENGTYELVRLMSTDPQDFLEQSYAPGTILS